MTELSDIFYALSATALTVTVIAAAVTLAVVAAPVSAVAIGGALVSTELIASVALAATTYAATAAAVTGAAALASNQIEQSKYRSYSVYFLQDSDGIIKYVGRVTDDGYRDRMAYHAATRDLYPAHRISGLNYYEARGLEEIGMIECHTLNPGNYQNNQIHGISPSNKNGSTYMSAAWDYLQNRAENWVLDIIS